MEFLKSLLVNSNIDKERLYDLIEQNVYKSKDQILFVYSYLNGNNVDIPDVIICEDYGTCKKAEFNYLTSEVKFTHKRTDTAYVKTQELADSLKGVLTEEMIHERDDISFYGNSSMFPVEYQATRYSSMSLERWLRYAKKN